jgi:hypothetical protein
MPRAIPDDHLGYPINIALSSGKQGSGFFFNAPGRIFVVTAKHVLFDANGHLVADDAVLTCQSRDPNDPAVERYKLPLGALHQAGHVLQHPARDVAALLFGSAESLPSNEGFFVKWTQGILTQGAVKGGLVGVAPSGTKRLSDVLVGNEVFLFGYPASLGIPEQPQFDHDKPLLRSGIVAGRYPAHGTIILDCPVFPGNSGGPVIEAERVGGGIKFWVVGVASQFVPLIEVSESKLYGHCNTQISNSGYSVAVAMDAVLDMLEVSA